ncbi:MAG: hypothetical protein JWR44_456 [Hymenobacter sp.]|jgi:uncharacterized protein YjbJ (UPF0337 family)|nr:hypothetical protein [Hymenobacter sp.]
MKKVTLLLALCAFTTAAFAQTTPTTEVKVRDNGTVKATTKTGKTNVGAALDNTKDAAGNVAHKTGSAIKRGAGKTKSAVKHGAHKVSGKAKDVSGKAKEGSATLENKTE